MLEKFKTKKELNSDSEFMRQRQYNMGKNAVAKKIRTVVFFILDILLIAAALAILIAVMIRLNIIDGSFVDDIGFAEESEETVITTVETIPPEDRFTMKDN